MRYLLDTNACILLLNRTDSLLAQRFRRTAPSQVRLCSAVKAALAYGAGKSSRPVEMRLKLRRVRRGFTSRTEASGDAHRS